MTRFLSESLQAPEPYFRVGLRRMEAANGFPNTDIRFSTEVMHQARVKARQLGFDINDCTPQELYYLVQERVKADDAKLTRQLRTKAATHVSAEADVVAGMVHVLKELPDSKRCFAIKPSSFRALIKQLPPKKTMKKLGYRSLDSFLKHESPALVLAAARLYEGPAWHNKLQDRYKHLRSIDFEDRSIALIHPDSPRWRELATMAVQEQKHNLISLKELGALVFLPLPKDAPAGSVTASLCLALHALNEIRAGSTYLKVCQVRPDFGSLVQTVSSDEPTLKSQLLDMPVPWNLVQRYYTQLKDFGATLSEPYLQLEDAAWHQVEETLSKIEPAFADWLGSSHLGILHNRQPLSLNLLDTALNTCNNIPFEQRLSPYFRRSLWQELLLRYLKPESIEQTVMGELQPQLAEEMAVA